jgi:hypothetical protein
MVGIEYSLLIASYSLSCWVNYGFYFLVPDVESWRGPFYIQMGLAAILFSMSFILPETPRWLARNGFTTECLQTVADLHAKGNIHDKDVQHVYNEIQQAVAYEKEVDQDSWKVRIINFSRYLSLIVAVIRICLDDTENAHSWPSQHKCLHS